MADDEVKWEATSSGQTTLFFVVFFISFYFKILHLTVPSPPKNQKVYVCHFLSLC